MKTSDIISEIFDSLAEFKPYIYYSALTGSVYIKFDNPRLRSLRIGDHDGREKYRYKWNLRYDINKSYKEDDNSVMRYYFPATSVGIDNLKTMLKFLQDELSGDIY
jgi:hypothetical protein